MWRWFIICNEDKYVHDIQRIDKKILEDIDRAGVPDMIGEIQSCWNSMVDFLQTGYGYCVLNSAGHVVCWCTAEYVSSGMCGVGIETPGDYQGQGIASAAAAAFAREAANRNWQLFWDSWLANTPSVRIAEKIGFQKTVEYSISLMILNR